MELLCNGSLAVPNGPTFPRPNDGLQFPRWQAVVPTDAPVMTIALDVTMLARLADALGSKTVILEISHPLHPVRVKPGKPGESAYGVIMPVRIQS